MRGSGALVAYNGRMWRQGIASDAAVASNSSSDLRTDSYNISLLRRN